MKRILLVIFSFVFCSWGYSQSVSPEVTASSGDHFTGANAQLSWTIGELMIDTYVDGSNQLTQGFHQTNLMITSVKDLAEGIQVKVFPNPTADLLNIEWTDISEEYTLTLHDASGKELLMQQVSGLQLPETIDLSAYSAGSYSLQLNNQNGNTIKTFIILKVK